MTAVYKQMKSFATMLGVLLITMNVAGPVPARAQEAMRVAAVVNDEAISVYDVAARVEFTIIAAGQKPTDELRRRLGPQVLRQLIDERLQMQEARNKEINISDAEVKEELAAIEGANRMPVGSVFAMLDQTGIPHDTMMTQLRARLVWQRLVIRKLRLSRQVSEDDVDTAVAEMKASLGKPQSLVAEIVLPVDRPDAEGEVIRTAGRLIEQARSGANFGVLARQFSQSASAAVEGDLGWILPGQLDPRIDAVVNRLRPGEVSEPIRTETGYHILTVRDRRETSGTPDPLTVRVAVAVLPSKADAATVPGGGSDPALAAARAIADRVNGCPALAEAVKPLDGKIEESKDFVAYDALPATQRRLVGSAAIGRAGEPSRTQRGIEIAMICERKGGTGMPTREEIRQRLELARMDSESRSYLRDLRQAAFVDIRQ